MILKTVTDNNTYSSVYRAWLWRSEVVYLRPQLCNQKKERRS